MIKQSAHPSLRKFYDAWSLQREGREFHVNFYYRFFQESDADRVIRALEKVVALNAAFRQTFVKEDGTLYVVLHDKLPFGLTRLEAQDDAREGELIEKLAAEPHDLNHESAIKLSLIKNFDAGSYTLLFNIHHILIDGEALEILLDNLQKALNAEPVMEATPLAYAQAIAQSPKAMTPFDRKAHAQYCSALEDASAQIESRIIRDRHQTFCLAGSLPPQMRTKLATLAQNSRISPFNLLLLLWSLFDCKINNRRATVVSYPVSLSRTRGLPGCFVNSIFLPLIIEDNASLATMIARFRPQIDAYKTLATIDEVDLRVQTQLGRPSSFFAHSVFAALGGIAIAGSYYPASPLAWLGRNPYGLFYFERNEHLHFQFSCFTCMFAPSVQSTMLERFFGFIDKVVSSPERVVNEINLLLEGEESQHMGEATSTPWRGENRADNLAQMFAHTAAEHPQRTAVTHNGVSLTYQELDESTDHIARALRRRYASLTGSELSPDTLIGLYFERSIEMVMAILAVLKSGAAYLPIDPAHPKERISHMLEEAHASLILSHDRMLESGDARALAGRAHLVSMDEILRSGRSHEQLPKIDGASLAYVMYTSGSTGKPKGVMIEHRTVVHYINDAKSFYAFTPEDAVLLFAPIVFDASVEHIWLAFASGAKLVVIDKDVLLDNAQLNRYLVANGVTHLHATPSFLSALDLAAHTGLKRVVAGGETFGRDLIEKFPDIRLINKYGPTEATITTHRFDVTAHQRRFDLGNVPIGWPLGHVQSYILDRNLQLCPAGLAGELYIGGECLARGYLNAPELTSERFLSNPFQTARDRAEGKNARIYKSGDLALRLPDGSIALCGRSDFQVKIRGFRIELQEIEHALRSLPSIRQAIVMIHEIGDHEPCLCAYYSGDMAPREEAVKSNLRTRLPEYMVPDFLWYLPSFPLTTNSKVNREALPRPDLKCRLTHYAPPRTAMQSLVCQAFADIFGLPRVSLDDDFNALGGSSILAIRLVNSLQGMIRISVSDLYKLRTPRQLAELEPCGPRERFIPTAARRDEYPVSFAEQRIFVASQIADIGTTYNIPYVMRIDGPLDVGAMHDALAHIIDRHEVLRSTYFARADGKVVRKILPMAAFSREMVGMAEEQLDDVCQGFVQPFDLAQGPLFRVKTLKVRGDLHYLLLDFHHIIFDGGSLAPLVRELQILYKKGEIPPPAIQYSDYAIWQREGAGYNECMAQRNYWTHLFNDMDLQPTVLPMASVHKAGSDFAGKSIWSEISGERFSALTAFAKEHGHSLYTITLAAFNMLLYRYTMGNPLIIGCTAHGRTLPQTQELIGMLVSTMPQPIRVDGAMKACDFLDTQRTLVLGMLANQDYPMEDLWEQLGIRSEQGKNPLFDILFNFLPAPMHDLPDSGPKEGLPIALETLRDERTAKFALTFHVMPAKEHIAIVVNYASSRFAPDHIAGFLRHYINILFSLVADPNTPIKDLELLSPEERHHILVDFNQTDREYPKTKSITDLFGESVAKYPQSRAVVDRSGALTYRELDIRSSQMAKFLRGHGVNKGDFVALLFTRSTDVIVAMLGVLKIGAAYIPLDRDIPGGRLREMLQSCNARVVTNIKENVPQGAIFMDWNALTPDQEEESNFAQLATIPTDNVAVMIYTSGSTGSPKGVMLTHRNIVNFAWHYIASRELRSAEDYAVHASFGFDVAIMGIYPPLFCGATVHILAEEVRHSLAQTKRYFDHYQIKGCFLTTQLAEQFMLFYDSPTLKFLDAGGEKLSLCRKRSYTLYNGYGPTEATVYTSEMRVDRDYLDIPIGKPIANMKVFILDRNLQPVPRGVSGELHITGDGLAKGYFGLAALNREKFIENIYQTAHEKRLGINSRLYRSGDLAKWHFDGNMEFVGRNDFQVKLRGYRIEPGEIERQMSRLEQVQKVVVTPIIKGDKTQCLCAYYTGGKKLAIPDIKAKLHEVLPDYMIPEHIFYLDAFPLNAHGKVNLAALPAPDFAACAKASFQSPVTELQEFICRKFSEVLAIDRVGVDDDFNRLGGNSIMAIRLVAFLKTMLDVTVSDLYKLRTPRQIATLSASSQAKTIRKGETRDRYLASFAEEAIFVTNQIGDLGTTYNVPCVIKIAGPLDLEALHAALARILKRHDVLRSVFTMEDGKVMRTVRPEGDFSLEVTAIHPGALQMAVRRFIAPFNLALGPLFHINLLEASAHLHYLLLDFHHIISDEGSQMILLDELRALYHQQELPEPAIHYGDFALWQRQGQGHQENLAAQEAYWVDRFRSIAIEPLDLPYDFARSDGMSYAGATLTLDVDADLEREVKELALKFQISLNAVFLSAVSLLLYRYTGQNHIIIGCATSGRNQLETQNLLGMFVSTHPMHNCITGDLLVGELLCRHHEHILEMIGNQDYPMAMLLKRLNLPSTRTSGRNPLFDVFYDFHDPQRGEDKSATNFNYEYPCDGDTAKFDLGFDVVVSAQGIKLQLNYKTALWHNKTAASMLRHLVNIVRGIVCHHQSQVKEIALLAPDERSLILSEFGRTRQPAESNKTLTGLFAAAVARFGDHIALAFEASEMSYRQLDDESTRLAHHLRSNYVAWTRNPLALDTLIGLWFEPGLPVIVALIAIMKSGAAYLPLDPDCPPERMRYMLDDAQVRLVLTHSDFLRAPAYAAIGDRCEFLCLDRIALPESCDQTLPGATPESLAYAIYTSGSTGNPKGVMIEHRTIGNFIGEAISFYKFGPGEAILLFAPMIVDAAVEEIWLALASGAKLVITRKETLLDPQQLKRSLHEHQVTHIDATPNFLAAIDIGEESSVKRLAVGGDVFRPELIAKYPGCEIYNEYGPTEATVVSHRFQVSARAPRGDDISIPIGKSLAHVKSYILDGDLQPVPVGVRGELYIGGECLARGYINARQTTLEKFLSNPFQTAEEKARGENARMYKTGDLALWRPDGNITYIGRVDFQVKIRGYRIELGEIEHALRQMPGILDAVVIADKDDCNREFLCAYYLARESLNGNKIREFLTARLPGPMIPDHCMHLDCFPLTPAGKIDRGALPKPDHSFSSQAGYAPPRSHKEQLICLAFAGVLDREKVGITDDFFLTGGNSLSAIRLAIALQEDFKVKPVDIFTQKTPEKLAQVLSFSDKGLKGKLKDLKKHFSEKKPSDADFAALAPTLADYRRSFADLVIDPNRCKPLQNILLTGATGFLGIHLLGELLSRTNCVVYTLVRASSDEEAKGRLYAKWQTYFGEPLDPHLGQRLIVYAGDLRFPTLGLDNGSYAQLAREINSIIHAAALVKHYGEYARFHEVNVLGTQHLVELAKTAGFKDFHYISTASVCNNGFIPGRARQVYREDDLPHEMVMENPYVRSKFNGELAALAARECGVCVNIYRIGNLAFHSETHQIQENSADNAFYALVRGLLHLGHVPTTEDEVEISPVDQTARAIVKILGKRDLENQVFHLYHPERYHLSRVLPPSVKGSALKPLAIADFIDQLSQALDQDEKREYAELFLFHRGWLAIEEQQGQPRTEIFLWSDRTLHILKQLDFTWKKLHPTMFDKLIRAALSHGGPTSKR